MARDLLQRVRLQDSQAMLRKLTGLILSTDTLTRSLQARSTWDRPASISASFECLLSTSLGGSSHLALPVACDPQSMPAYLKIQRPQQCRHCSPCIYPNIVIVYWGTYRGYLGIMETTYIILGYVLFHELVKSEWAQKHVTDITKSHLPLCSLVEARAWNVTTA